MSIWSHLQVHSESTRLGFMEEVFAVVHATEHLTQNREILDDEALLNHIYHIVSERLRKIFVAMLPEIMILITVHVCVSKLSASAFHIRCPGQSCWTPTWATSRPLPR